MVNICPTNAVVDVDWDERTIAGWTDEDDTDTDTTNNGELLVAVVVVAMAVVVVGVVLEVLWLSVRAVERVRCPRVRTTEAWRKGGIEKVCEGIERMYEGNGTI